jgi:hypothetical protein
MENASHLSIPAINPFSTATSEIPVEDMAQWIILEPFEK